MDTERYSTLLCVFRGYLSTDGRTTPDQIGTRTRLYRERADAENVYDELKNQWGWNGFTTRKLAPCRLMANLVALVYNWWHLYVARRCLPDDRARQFIKQI